MIVAVVFFWILAAGAAYYMARHDIAAKPWLERGALGGSRAPLDRRGPAAQAGLIMVMAVVGVLFALLSSAFVMRAGDSDWLAAPVPRLLWFNTGLLFVSSLALEGSARAARNAQARKAEGLLLTATLAAIAFLLGQIVAWRQFTEAGFGVASNPGDAFFYLMTGLHAAHLLGGLLALAITWAQTGGQIVSQTARLRLKLCAVYWHFLLLVWLFLFALLEGWGGAAIAICRGLYY